MRVREISEVAVKVWFEVIVSKAERVCTAGPTSRMALSGSLNQLPCSDSSRLISWGCRASCLRGLRTPGARGAPGQRRKA